MKIDKYTVVSESYQKAKNLQKRLRREQQRQDKADAEARRNGWDMDAAQAETLKVEINGTVIEMDRWTAYALMHSRQAKLVIDLDTPVDYVAA